MANSSALPPASMGLYVTQLQSLLSGFALTFGVESRYYGKMKKMIFNRCGCNQVSFISVTSWGSPHLFSLFVSLILPGSVWWGELQSILRSQWNIIGEGRDLKKPSIFISVSKPCLAVSCISFYELPDVGQIPTALKPAHRELNDRWKCTVYGRQKAAQSSAPRSILSHLLTNSLLMLFWLEGGVKCQVGLSWVRINHVTNFITFLMNENVTDWHQIVLCLRIREAGKQPSGWVASALSLVSENPAVWGFGQENTWWSQPTVMATSLDNREFPVVVSIYCQMHTA